MVTHVQVECPAASQLAWKVSQKRLQSPRKTYVSMKNLQSLIDTSRGRWRIDLLLQDDCREALPLAFN